MISGVPRPIRFIEPAVQAAFPRHVVHGIDITNQRVPPRAKRWMNVPPVIDAGKKYRDRPHNEKFLKARPARPHCEPLERCQPTAWQGEMFSRIGPEALYDAIRKNETRHATPSHAAAPADV
jgi:hypothetical protein